MVEFVRSSLDRTFQMSTTQFLVRVGVTGDIHAESRCLETALAFLKKANLDLIISVGDVVDGLDVVEKRCELLLENNVVTVRGDHDCWFLEGVLRATPHATGAVLSPLIPQNSNTAWPAIDLV
ncbi:MAG: hypothetical protein GTO24_15450 [candidate division Zixibacteria bacterium]|nr:hypothetical protein [candidate division Zixibacteria bacterium]